MTIMWFRTGSWSGGVGGLGGTNISNLFMFPDTQQNRTSHLNEMDEYKMMDKITFY